MCAPFSGLFVRGQRTMSGKGLSSVDGYAPAASDLNILYLDIDTFYLVFICRGPNYKTGMCDKPAFHVLTRNRPDKMTADQLQAIDNIVDAALAPFCFSSADVQQQMFTDNKPFCTPTEYAAAGCALKSVTALMQDIGNSTSN
ncbi:uncharacterized protein LOC129594704 isoform X2 [Paramacrobiotus metropolitanus]|uniref:uncharacterized protein LOC129594704 isoform X2 n=1 Tax=Paramacrobiotus metropolitanus TaxID=2943436 RepID=UPI002445D523|nr:uncharacterized protein LOC129594704 isoform X2 [Paramacrobiotus metropolitanus]XP_055347455.1 uncharacterized protein LOC129594704 isoform X2 [Paramacrobiotus metropolitanus]